MQPIKLMLTIMKRSRYLWALCLLQLVPACLFAQAVSDNEIVFTDANGNIVKNFTMGGSGQEEALSIRRTSDGGFIVASYTYSSGAGDADAHILKLNSAGGVAWSKTIGGTAEDKAFSASQTADGNFLVAGTTASFGSGGKDLFVAKLDPNGALLWWKTVGGGSEELVSGSCIIRETKDGGIIIAGQSNSFGFGNDDVYVIKLDACGKATCNQKDATPAVATVDFTPNNRSLVIDDGASRINPVLQSASPSLITDNEVCVGTVLLLCDPASELSCGQPVFMVSNTLYQNSSQVAVAVKVENVDNMNVSNGVPNGHVAASSTLTAALNNPAYFQYLGSVIFNPSDPASQYHGYRLVAGYTAGAEKTLDYITLDAAYNGNTFSLGTTYSKNCGKCPSCPHRMALQQIYSMLANTFQQWVCTFDQVANSWVCPQFPSLSATHQQQLSTMLNWYINNTAPAVADYANVLAPASDAFSADIPSGFCQPGHTDENSCTNVSVSACKCQKEIYVYLEQLKTWLPGSCPPSAVNCDAAESQLLKDFYLSCGCMNNYCVQLNKLNAGAAGGGYDGFELWLTPVAQAGLPVYVMKGVFDPNVVPGQLTPYAVIASSCQYPGPSDQYPDVGIIYNGNGQFTYTQGFSEFVKP